MLAASCGVHFSRSLRAAPRPSRQGHTPIFRTTRSAPRPMIEREDELAEIDRCLRAAHAGSGAMLLVEGAAGIGKSTLLAAAIARARQQQMLVLSARGDELERSFSYAVVRQLFEAALTAVDGDVRAGWLSGAAAHAAPVGDPFCDARTEAPDPSAGVAA